MPPRKKDSDESAESLAKKLGVKPDGMSIALLWPPEGFAERLGLESGSYDTDLVMGKYDLILFFTASRVLLREFFPLAVTSLEPKGRIWICYPRTSEGQRTDLELDSVRTLAESLDLIEVSRGRVEEAWNGIKFKRALSRLFEMLP